MGLCLFLQFDRKWMVPDTALSGEAYATQNESVQMRDKITSLERMMAL